MLPEFLFGTYRQYKTDTEKITTWLAETAKKCGYKSPSLDPAASNGDAAAGQNGKPAKLKGRARKLARDAAVAAAAEKKKTPSASSSIGDANVKVVEKKFTVPVREFEAMAAHIVKTRDATLKIPRGFVNLMKKCIERRRGTSDWFEENVPATAEEEVDSTARHLHFANVLQRSLQTLLPVGELRTGNKMARDGQSNNPSATEPVSRGDLANAFSLLTVDETEDETFDPLNALVLADSGDKQAPAPEKVRYVVDTEEDDDGEEWFFALHCFFFDIHELRIFIALQWSMYKNGDIDLATAAVTTNTAYDLMRRAEEDFNKEMRIPKEYAGKFPDGDVVELYYVDVCLRAGLEPKSLERRSIVDFERWSFVRESFQLPYRLLVSFRKGIEELGSIPVTRPASLGTYTPGIDRTKLEPKELCEQDSGLLMDFLVTVGPYVAIGDSPNDDELMKGIEVLIRQKQRKITLWLVFAAQSYLDIHHILMKDADKPLEDLQKFGREAQSTLQEHFAFVEDHSVSQLRTKKSESIVHDTLKEIEEWALGDKLTRIMSQEIGKEQQRRGRRGKSRVWQPNELLKMHPLLCGMMKYSFHLQLQWEGIHLLNETEIMVAAHLYNALKQCGYLPDGCEWEDMNLLIEMHGTQDIFLGDLPTTIEDCTKRLAMFQGVSPQTFARNRRIGGHRVIFSKTGGRILKQASHIASIFRNRFLSGGDVDLSLASVEALLGQRMEERRKILDMLKEILRKRGREIEVQEEVKKVGNLSTENTEQAPGDKSPNVSAKQAEPGENESATDHTNGTAADAAEGKEEAEDDNASTDQDVNREAITRRWHALHQLSIQDFLTELSTGLHSEHPSLSYDYFSFFRRVWSLLESIQAKTQLLLQERLDEYTIETLCTRTEGITMVPGVAMLMACDPRKAPNMLPLTNWQNADDTVLRAAAEVMREFVEREGAVEAEREAEVLQRQQEAGGKFDEETTRALDEIKSIRDVTGAVAEEDGLDAMDELVDELLDATAY